MSPAQADQILVQPEHIVAVFVDTHLGGEPNSGRTASSPPNRSSFTPR